MRAVSPSGLRLSLALYLPALLLALAAAVPLLLAGLALDETGPHTRRVASGDWVDVALELQASTAGRAVLEEEPAPSLRAASGRALVAGALVPVAAALQYVSYSFASGGLLTSLLGHGGGFWRSCRAWFWPMLRYGVLVWLAGGFLGLVGGALAALAPGVSPAQAPLRAGGLLLWLGLVNGVLEVGRADMLLRDDRRALRALGRSLSLPRHPSVFARALGAWLLLGLASAALWALSVLALTRIPALALAPSILALQALAFAGAWLKLVRLSIALSVARAAWVVPPLDAYPR